MEQENAGAARHLVSAAVTDKRLLVAETEFARTLKAMGRTGSTLTEVLRSAWDDGDLRIITRSHPIKATGTHVSFIGHITEEELEKELGECERFNGFANRFLWATAERNKLLPEGGNLDRRRLAELADALGKSIVRARKIGVMLRDEEARNHWDSAYREARSRSPRHAWGDHRARRSTSAPDLDDSSA